MIAYEINSSSPNVVVECVRDIRPINYNENGSYALPERLRARYPEKSLPGERSSALMGSGTSKIYTGFYFVRKLGLVPDGNKALIYLQPYDVYLPDFEYGPITDKIVISRDDNVYKRSLTKDGMPSVEMDVFKAIEVRAKSGPMTEPEIDKFITIPCFADALKKVFDSVGFEFAVQVLR